MKCKVCKTKLKKNEVFCSVCESVIEENTKDKLYEDKRENFILYNIYKNKNHQKHFEKIILMIGVLFVIIFFNYVVTSPLLLSATKKVSTTYKNMLFYNLSLSFLMAMILMTFGFYVFGKKRKTSKKAMTFEVLDFLIYGSYLTYYGLKYIKFINPVITEIYTKYPMENYINGSMNFIYIYKITYIIQIFLHLIFYILIKNKNFSIINQINITLGKYKYEKQLEPIKVIKPIKKPILKKNIYIPKKQKMDLKINDEQKVLNKT